MDTSNSSKTTVYAALAGNALVAVTKLVAAAWTGSSSMLSEGIHSIVDTGNEILLLYGYRRAERPPDSRHPLGYGRELYFWSFIVALLLFALGAGAAFYEGVIHILQPVPVRDVRVNYAVLGLAFLFEAASWLVAVRGFRRAKGEAGWWQAVRDSKDPPSFMVLLEDSAALVGIAIAAASLALAEATGRPELDGVGSLLIGLLLAVTAFVLGQETKALLIGERASAAVRASILDAAARVDGIVSVQDLVTVHLSPTQIVVALDVEFEDRLAAPAIERCVQRLEAGVRERHAEVVALFVKPRAPAAGVSG
jgi:cation diffusion facilitator family transporter